MSGYVAIAFGSVWQNKLTDSKVHVLACNGRHVFFELMGAGSRRTVTQHVFRENYVHVSDPVEEDRVIIRRKHVMKVVVDLISAAHENDDLTIDEVEDLIVHLYGKYGEK